MKKLTATFSALLLTFALSPRGVCLEAPTPTPEKPKVAAAVSADQLFDSVQSATLADLWEPVSRLVNLGRTDGGAIAARFEEMLAASKDAKVRLACARALSQINRAEKAAPALADLVEHAESPEVRRAAANAITLAVPLHSNPTVLKALSSAMKNDRDDATKIVLARGHMRITKTAEGRDILKNLMQTSTDANVRDEAALVLAENGGLVPPRSARACPDPLYGAD